jgi:hypothetical protein
MMSASTFPISPPLPWKADLSWGWWVYIGATAVLFGGLTQYAVAQALYRAEELNRIRSRRLSPGRQPLVVEYRRLVMSVVATSAVVRCAWLVDPAAWEGLFPPWAATLLLRIPQCLILFLSALLVAFV